MDVYFIPVAPDRYELYCEHDENVMHDAGDAEPKGRFAALYVNFKEALARVERERLRGDEPPDVRGQSWTERLKARMLGWIAEKVAEQRLLWRLRNESAVVLHHPDDMPADGAMALSRSELQREADRHLKWMIVDGVLFVASGALALIPGPNLIAYYFGFRLVGHYLSRRGAVHGLREISWEACASPPLSRLRRVPLMTPHERERELREVASALQLSHLARFFERISMKTA